MNQRSNQTSNNDLKTSIVAILTELGEDVSRDGLLETPARFEKQIRECLVGYHDDPNKYLKLFENDGFHDLVSVSQIAFSSLCEHHLLPFSGYIDIAYVPGEKILGLSKFARIVDAFSKRLQVQERLTKELSEFLFENLDPELLMVRVKASHSCMTIRGVLRPESITETSMMLGDVESHQRHIDYFQNVNGNRS